MAHIEFACELKCCKWFALSFVIKGENILRFYICTVKGLNVLFYSFNGFYFKSSLFYAKNRLKYKMGL